jgi:hypothetical protein
VRAPFLPILPGIERGEDWQAFHEGVRASLSPVGIYEEDLTRRLAHVLWRWHRLERHEVKVVMQGVRERASFDTRQGLDIVLEQSREAIEREERQSRAALTRLQTLTNGASAELMFSAAESETIMSGFIDTLEEQLADDDDDDDDENGDADEGDKAFAALSEDSQNSDAPSEVEIEQRDYNALELLTKIQTAAKAAAIPDWRPVLSQYVTERLRRQAEWQAGLSAARVHIELCLIPDERNLSRLCDYERHLSCELRKLRSLLEREQALRKGQPVAPPLAVDVQLSAVPAPPSFP